VGYYKRGAELRGKSSSEKQRNFVEKSELTANIIMIEYVLFVTFLMSQIGGHSKKEERTANGGKT
jgi:hypothetical protein